MIPRAGSGVAFSLLIVTVAAVALHRPESKLALEAPADPPEAPLVSSDLPAPASSPDGTPARTVSSSSSPPSPPRPTPAVPWTEPPLPSRAETASIAASPAPSPPPPAPAPPARSPSASASPPAIAQSAPLRRPSSWFTRVAPGETLATVARRIYGPSADPHALWLSNRDLLADMETSLRPGMVLRTPEL